MKEKILMSKHELCPSCMEIHDVHLIETETSTIFKGIKINCPAKYFFCNNTKEFFSDEELLTNNIQIMKNTYQEKISDSLKNDNYS